MNVGFLVAAKAAAIPGYICSKRQQLTSPKILRGTLLLIRRSKGHMKRREYLGANL